MPNYKGHLIGGLITFVGARICLQFLNPTLLTSCEWLLFVLIGSLFPDIDTKSKGQKYAYQIFGVLVIFFLLQGRYKTIAYLSCLALSPLIIRHRGITHSLHFIFSLTACIMLYVFLVTPHALSFVFFDILFFVLGAFSHIVLDLGLKRAIRL